MCWSVLLHLNSTDQHFIFLYIYFFTFTWKCNLFILFYYFLLLHGHELNCVHLYYCILIAQISILFDLYFVILAFARSICRYWFTFYFIHRTVQIYIYFFNGLAQTVLIAVKGMFQENHVVIVHNQWAVLFLNRDVFIQSEAHILFVIGLLQKP